MDQDMEKLLPDLSRLISQRKLFVGSIRYVGFCVFIVLYEHPDVDSLTTIDIVLFDIAEETTDRLEIVNPENLNYVSNFLLSDNGVYGRNTTVIEIDEESGATRNYKIYYHDAAVYVTTKPIHRLD